MCFIHRRRPHKQRGVLRPNEGCRAEDDCEGQDYFFHFNSLDLERWIASRSGTEAQTREFFDVLSWKKLAFRLDVGRGSQAFFGNVVSRAGLEPATHWLKASCSTN